MSDEASEIIAHITKQGGLFEVHEVRTFGGYLNDSNEEVVVTIHDNGDKNPSRRYSASAFVVDDPNRVTASNPEPSIDMAIRGVHWNELKRR